MRAEPRVDAHRPVPLAARRHADPGNRQARRERRHVLAGAGHRADAGRLVPGRRLSDLLQGQVARLARAPRRRRRRRVPALDRRRRDADRGQHPEVPRGRPARRLRLLGVGRPRAARTRQAQHRHAQGPVHRRRDDRAAQAPRRRRGRRAVADGVLVPQPARRLDVRRHRAHAGAALPPLTGAARRAGTDAQRGPLHEALLPTELRRQLEHDHRAAAVERAPPEVLLPDAGRGRPPHHACPRRAARHRRLREHDRDLRLRSRRHAGRPRRDAREVARRLRGSAARAVHRLQPIAARRRPRARHPDQPRRPHPDAARLRRDRSRSGARPLAGRPQRRPPARRTRPLAGDPRRRTGGAHGADPLHDRR